MTVIKNVEKVKSGKHQAPTPLDGRKVEKMDRSDKEDAELESIFVNLSPSPESINPADTRASLSKKDNAPLRPEADHKVRNSAQGPSQPPQTYARSKSIEVKGIKSFLQHPFRVEKDDIVLGSGDYPLRRYPTATPGTDKNYFARLRKQTVSFSIEIKSKLIVLSLNGDLGVKVARGEFLPRPFLGNLMEYLTSGHAVPSRGRSNPAYAIMVWSAMVPHNVQPCVDSLIGPWKSAVVDVWDRTQLNLASSEYWEHPPVWKDLNKVFEHFEKGARTYRPPGAAARRLDFVPTIDNTIMVEESAFKANLQPFNHLAIKEYTLDICERSTEACYQYDEGGRMEVGANGAVNRSASLLGAIFQHGSSDFYEEYVHGNPPQYQSEMTMGLDGTLLGLIGILSEMENVSSVPVWLAAGGLTPAVSHTFTKQIASKGWKHIVRLDRGDEDLSARLASRAHALPKVALPGSEGYLSWFDSPIHLLYWIRRGLTALDRKGIKVEHGM